MIMKSKKLASVLALMVTAWMVSSCEKMVLSESAKSEEAAGANVVLRVASFEMEEFGHATRADIADLCSRLTFVVYNDEGEKLKTVLQKEGDSDFGAVSMTLAEGDYNLCVFAHSSNGNPSLSDLSKIKFENKMGFSDTFHYFGRLSVGESRQEVKLKLKRITSLFRFIITDDFPSNVTKLNFRYTGGSGAFDAATGYGSVKSQQSVDFSIDGNQKQFDLYTILWEDTAKLKFTVTAYDASNEIVKKQEFADVPMQRNMITKYTGSFFSGTSSSGSSEGLSFVLEVEGEWGGEQSYRN